MKRHTILIEAVEPIAHGDTVTGIDNQTNTRLFMRSALIVNGVPARVPDVSENSIRSVMFREPLHDHLLAALGIRAGELPQSVMNLLYSGGNMAAGAKAPGDEIALGHAVKKLYPSLDLLGGAVDTFILPRSRLRLAAWPIAKEFAPILSHVAPDLVGDAEKVSIFDLLFEETRTRGTGSDSDGNQMIYTYETLAAGAKILIELTFDSAASDATLGAARCALDSWDGYFGGQARQGRGRCATVHHDLPASDSYIEHVGANRDHMRAGLTGGTLGTGKRLCA